MGRDVAYVLVETASGQVAHLFDRLLGQVVCGCDAVAVGTLETMPASDLHRCRECERVLLSASYIARRRRAEAHAERRSLR